MTGPDPAPRPSVTTAPAEGGASGAASPRAPLGRRRLPPHLGPARTSTVLLAVAFVAIGVLYLFVKPPETRTTGVVTDPVTTSGGIAPTTQAPAATPPPEPTPTPEETAAPTSSEAAPTTSEAPEEPTVEPTPTPEEPTPTPEEPTPPAPTTGEPLPTTAAPTSG